MEENKRIIKKHSYIWLICFDIAFSLINGLLFVPIAKGKDLAVMPLVAALVVFDIIASVVIGSVSYVKYRSVLKTNLLFVVSWISFFCVLFVCVAKEYSLWIIKFIYISMYSLCFFLFGSLVTMLIFKVRNAVVKSKKSGIAQETEYIEDRLTKLMKSKPSQIRSKKENSSAGENASKE